MDVYFQTLAASASYASGSIIQDNRDCGFKRILLNRGIRDVDENNGKGAQESLIVHPVTRQLQLISSSPMTTKFAAQSLSPSGSKEVCFSNVKPPAGSEAVPAVEVVHHAGSACFGNIKIDLSSAHGPIIGDTWFGGVSWSADEVFVAYVAKVKVGKKTTAVESVTSPGGATSTPAAADSVNKYDFVDDWGEKYVDVTNLGIYILNTINGKVYSLPNVDVAQWTVGQPQFIPTSAASYRIAYTAWNSLPRRLGMIYCYHRPCSIFLADITSLLSDDGSVVNHQLLSRNIKLARSPRAAPDGLSLIFLGSRKGYSTHGGCSELFRVPLTGDLSSVEAETIVSEVDLPSSCAASGSLYTRRREHLSFPGLYLDQLPARCFVDKQGRRLLCSSLWGSIEEVLLVDTTTKDVAPISALVPTLAEAVGLSSLQVLDVSSTYTDDGCDVLFTFSAPNAPVRAGFISLDVANLAASTLSLGPMPRLFSITNKINLFQSDYATDIIQQLSQKISFQLFSHHDQTGIPFESILIAPTGISTSLPVVVVPHGGPHSCFSTAFVAAYVYLANTLQSAVLYVNYRGSTGFGQRSIHSLAGTIGTNDVQDMMTCLHHALSLPHPLEPTQTWLNREKVAVCGGSHGGFLGAHLSAQYPEVFKAAALRNPVTDIAAMVGVSDIPDWCYTESLGVELVESGTLDWSNPSPGIEVLSKMRQVSPVHVSSVTTRGKYLTPTLICLGMKDRRVPPSQGVAFYQLLRLYHGDRVPLSLMTFPEDVHAIDLPSTEAEHWIAIAKWFQTHL